MHVPAYEDRSTRMRRGALALPGLGGLTDRPAWITSWMDQVSGLLDQILVCGEYRKVDCCHTWTVFGLTLRNSHARWKLLFWKRYD